MSRGYQEVAEVRAVPTTGSQEPDRGAVIENGRRENHQEWPEIGTCSDLNIKGRKALEKTDDVLNFYFILFYKNSPLYHLTVKRKC